VIPCHSGQVSYLVCNPALHSLTHSLIQQVPTKTYHGWALVLTPVILATREAESRRIEVQSQPWQIVCKTLSLKNPS
jgi:hypothetical protein